MRINWSRIENENYTYNVHTDTAQMRNMAFIPCEYDGRKPITHSDLMCIDEQLEAEEIVYGSPDGCNRKDKRGEARAQRVLEADRLMLEETEHESLAS